MGLIPVQHRPYFSLEWTLLQFCMSLTSAQHSPYFSFAWALLQLSMGLTSVWHGPYFSLARNLFQFGLCLTSVQHGPYLSLAWVLVKFGAALSSVQRIFLFFAHISHCFSSLFPLLISSFSVIWEETQGYQKGNYENYYFTLRNWALNLQT